MTRCDTRSINLKQLGINNVTKTSKIVSFVSKRFQIHLSYHMEVDFSH